MPAVRDAERPSVHGMSGETASGFSGGSLLAVSFCASGHELTGESKQWWAVLVGASSVLVSTASPAGPVKACLHFPALSPEDCPLCTLCSACREHVHVHARVCTCVCARVYVRAHVCMYACAHVCACVCLCVHACACLRTEHTCFQGEAHYLTCYVDSSTTH